jgi:hypothetical protein
MEKSFRPLRMVGSIANLLVALVSLEGTYELVMDSLMPLIRYGNEFTVYGWGVIGAIVARVVITGALFWAFARLGSSKPFHLAHLARSASPATPTVVGETASRGV